MLPDFVRIKERRAGWFKRTVEEAEQARTPLLQRMHAFRQHEGQECAMQRVDGTEDRIEYSQRLESKLLIKLDELPNLDTEGYKSKATQIAEDLAQQKMGMFFQKLDTVTSEAGMVFHHDGDIGPDVFLRTLEQLEVDFGPAGDVENLVIACSPDTFDKFKHKLPFWEKDPDIMRRHNEIMARKWIEWRDREADRTLVD